ncbi:MAG TPA: ubiquinol-cytochrome c reductase iron-sulfur subunit [Acidobacteriaceae bacterium]|nr:ubiquinol-cytochrome c reductase iron-sulfur subunit [Acidobacteriaceae bacterium]
MAELLGEGVQQEKQTETSEAKKDVIVLNRRSFFGALIAVGSVGMGAILSVPVLRYVLYPLYAKAAGTEWSDVGELNEFANSKGPIRKTITFAQRDGWREVVSAQSVYVSRNVAGELEVLSAICPHLGCSVSWQQAQDEFVCPCHGGRFAPDGKHVFGPPPRGMDQLPVRVKDGKLQVHFEYFRSNVPNQEKLS